MKIPEGIYAFTVDGEELGLVAAVRETEFELETTGGGRAVLPVSAAQDVEAGKLVLDINARQARDRYGIDVMAGQVPAEPHLDPAVLRAAWAAISIPDWGEIARAADERLPDISEAERADLGRVAQDMAAAGVAFPGDEATFARLVEEHAATMPHESSGADRP